MEFLCIDILIDCHELFFCDLKHFYVIPQEQALRT